MLRNTIWGRLVQRCTSIVYGLIYLTSRCLDVRPTRFYVAFLSYSEQETSIYCFSRTIRNQRERQSRRSGGLGVGEGEQGGRGLFTYVLSGRVG